jgi:hypothetical protein
MTVITIDPGAKTGGCIMDAVGPPLAFAIAKPDVWQIYRTLAWAQERARGELELMIEDQHLQLDPQAMLTLARTAERWATIAEQRRIKWTRVQPASWHTALSDVPKVDETGKTLTAKARARLLVERLWSEIEFVRGEPGRDLAGPCLTAKLPQDPVEAIVMARWRLLGAGRTKRERAPKKRGKR